MPKMPATASMATINIQTKIPSTLVIFVGEKEKKGKERREGEVGLGFLMGEVLVV